MIPEKVEFGTNTCDMCKSGVLSWVIKLSTLYLCGDCLREIAGELDKMDGR